MYHSLKIYICVTTCLASGFPGRLNVELLSISLSIFSPALSIVPGSRTRTMGSAQHMPLKRQGMDAQVFAVHLKS